MEMSLKNLVRRLDLTTLQLFLAVHEEGTLTRAAQRESIAVSAASKRLLELEQAVSAALFVRQPKGMTLTPAGETLLHHARRMLADIEKIGIELAEHAQGIRGYVRMVANLSAIVEFLPEDLRAFQLLHPQIKLDLDERPSGGVVKAVANSLADLGICSGDSDTQALEAHHYRCDSLVLVVRDDHPLADREQVAFAETLDSDHVGLHSASSINIRTHLAARQAGKPLRLRIHVPGFDAVCRMVQAGMGVGVIPRNVYTALGRPLGLAAVALSDDWNERSLKIVVRDVNALSPVSRLLFDFLRTLEAQS
jgi:DNA-binding transcriptional LysR family regulator